MPEELRPHGAIDANESRHFAGVNKVEIGEVSVPKPGPGEVLVRTVITGIR